MEEEIFYDSLDEDSVLLDKNSATDSSSGLSSVVDVQEIYRSKCGFWLHPKGTHDKFESLLFPERRKKDFSENIGLASEKSSSECSDFSSVVDSVANNSSNEPKQTKGERSFSADHIKTTPRTLKPVNNNLPFVAEEYKSISPQSLSKIMNENRKRKHLPDFNGAQNLTDSMKEIILKEKEKVSRVLDVQKQNLKAIAARNKEKMEKLKSEICSQRQIASRFRKTEPEKTLGKVSSRINQNGLKNLCVRKSKSKINVTSRQNIILPPLQKQNKSYYEQYKKKLENLRDSPNADNQEDEIKLSQTLPIQETLELKNKNEERKEKLIFDNLKSFIENKQHNIAENIKNKKLRSEIDVEGQSQKTSVKLNIEHTREEPEDKFFDSLQSISQTKSQIKETRKLSAVKNESCGDGHSGLTIKYLKHPRSACSSTTETSIIPTSGAKLERTELSWRAKQYGNLVSSRNVMRLKNKNIRSGSCSFTSRSERSLPPADCNDRFCKISNRTNTIGSSLRFSPTLSEENLSRSKVVTPKTDLITKSLVKKVEAPINGYEVNDRYSLYEKWHKDMTELAFMMNTTRATYKMSDVTLDEMRKVEQLREKLLKDAKQQQEVRSKITFLETNFH